MQMLLRRGRKGKNELQDGTSYDEKPLVYSHPVAWIDSTPGTGIGIC
jgi:hypothetical protein